MKDKYGKHIELGCEVQCLDFVGIGKVVSINEDGVSVAFSHGIYEKPCGRKGTISDLRVCLFPDSDIAFLDEEKELEKTNIGGKKFDSDKLDWSVLDLAFVEPLIPVFKLGESRYGYMNWSKPFDNSSRRFYAATMRHVKASQYDPLAINEEDGGVYHLAQISWNCLMRLRQALENQKSKQNSDE